VVRNQIHGGFAQGVYRAHQPGKRIAAQFAESEKPERAKLKHHANRSEIFGPILGMILDVRARVIRPTAAT